MPILAQGLHRLAITKNNENPGQRIGQIKHISPDLIKYRALSAARSFPDPATDGVSPTFRIPVRATDCRRIHAEQSNFDAYRRVWWYPVFAIYLLEIRKKEPR
jgi:hypothetical protein